MRPKPAGTKFLVEGMVERSCDSQNCCLKLFLAMLGKIVEVEEYTGNRERRVYI